MAFSLRLPEALEQRARDRAQAVGVSLNAMVCVALDAYLRAGIPPVQPGTKAIESGERVAGLPQRQPVPVATIREPNPGAPQKTENKAR